LRQKVTGLKISHMPLSKSDSGIIDAAEI